MVKIDKEYRHLAAVALREGNAVFQPIIKECTIGEGRKLIVLGQVRHLLRDGTRLTHVVKTTTIPANSPLRSYIGAAESSICNSWPSRRTSTQLGGKMIVRPFCIACSICGTMRSRVVPSST